MRYFIKTLTDYALCIYLVLILGVMPFYNRAGYSHMGTDKAFFYNTITVYMGRIFLALVLVYLVISLKDLRKLTLRDLRSRLSVADMQNRASSTANKATSPLALPWVIRAPKPSVT